MVRQAKASYLRDNPLAILEFRPSHGTDSLYFLIVISLKNPSRLAKAQWTKAEVLTVLVGTKWQAVS